MRRVVAIIIPVFYVLCATGQQYEGKMKSRNNPGRNSSSMVGVGEIKKSKNTSPPATNYYIQKGYWDLEGGMSFKSSWYETGGVEYSDSRFRIHPNIGYFVMDQLEVELGVGYQTSTVKTGTNPSVKSHSIWFIPGIKYYFFDETHPINLFAEAEYGFGSSKSGAGNKVSAQRYDLRAGPVFFLKQFFAIELAVGYGGLKYETFDYWENCFDICAGFDCYFGPCNNSKQVELAMAKY
jgi:hypothetical protein